MRFARETGTSLFEMRIYRFGMFLPPNWRFSLKIGSFAQLDAPVSRFGTEFAYSSAKTKKQWARPKTGSATKRGKIMINAQILPTAFYGIQNFLDNFNAEAAKGECTYTPKADYYETENGFALEVELPGVKKEDMDIQVEKNIITVKATRVRSKDEKFTFERSFRLADDIDTENIKVSLENGILKFDLSKKAQAAARKLTIG